jgi:LPS export ABC transporter protein LptC
MAIRIEYLFVILIFVLLGSIIGITPSSHEAKSSNAQRELEFQNFSLYNIQKDKATQEVFAVNMTKYKNHIEMRDIDLKDEKGYQLFSKDAIYDEDMIYMESGVRVLSQDGYEFITSSLNYNVKSKDIQTDEPFILEYNRSVIQGQNLALSLRSKEISADKIEAKIYFVTQE